MVVRRSVEMILGLGILLGVLAGCGGGGGDISVDVTEVSTGAPMENLLKGMSVAVDPKGNRCFVSGIMTDTVGVVDLESATLLDVFPIEENVPA
ncbi:MAG: hypothetical protein QF645_12695, partial [Planctomycetota bacterium]|nr:hypothetical protein [Planctomycetota bacterium]